MICKPINRWVALALAAMLCLSACGGEPVSDANPAAGPDAQAENPPSASVPAEPEPAQPEHSVPVQTPEPSPEPEPEPEPEPIVGLMPLSEPVEEEWFADAVFLGDSRTDGLMLYSGIKSATFFSYKGLSVFNADTKECISLNGKDVTIINALAEGEYSKVYLMLGINELGYPASSYKEAYQDIVAQIKEAQPNATIYLQNVIPVNETVGARKGMSPYITNNKVVQFNEVIAEIAEEEEVALVNVAEAFWTEEGCLAADNTSDGVHLTRQGYVAWFEYLKSHTGTNPPLGEPVVFEPDDPDTPKEETPPDVPASDSTPMPDGESDQSPDSVSSPDEGDPPAAESAETD